MTGRLLDEVQVLTGGEVLLTGQAVLWVATALERAAQAQRLNGTHQGPIVVLAHAFVVAARRVSSDSGTAELRQVGAVAGSAMADPLTAAQVAGVLGCSGRYVRTLCSRGAFATAQRVGGRWLIEKVEVATWAARREAG